MQNNEYSQLETIEMSKPLPRVWKAYCNVKDTELSLPNVRKAAVLSISLPAS